MVTPDFDFHCYPWFWWLPLILETSPPASPSCRSPPPLSKFLIWFHWDLWFTCSHVWFKPCFFPDKNLVWFIVHTFCCLCFDFGFWWKIICSIIKSLLFPLLGWEQGGCLKTDEESPHCQSTRQGYKIWIIITRTNCQSSFPICDCPVSTF